MLFFRCSSAINQILKGFLADSIMGKYKQFQTIDDFLTKFFISLMDVVNYCQEHLSRDIS